MVICARLSRYSFLGRNSLRKFLVLHLGTHQLSADASVQHVAACLREQHGRIYFVPPSAWLHYILHLFSSAARECPDDEHSHLHTGSYGTVP